MRTALFYNVGQSDVVIDGQTKNEFSVRRGKALDFRTPTESVYRELIHAGRKVRPSARGLFLKGGRHVEFPILGEIMMYLQQEGLDFEDVILFASDQKGPYRVTDTIWGARLIARFLHRRKPGTRTQIVRIPKNPQDYDAMMKFYEGYVENHEGEIGERFKNILALAPGTPACTFALMMCFLPFADRTMPLYVPRGERPKRVSVMTGMTREGYRRLLDRAIRAYEYKGAQDILREANFEQDRHLDDLFEALCQRLNFRFDRAYETFHRFRARVDHQWEPFEVSFFKLAQRNYTKERLVELFYHIQLCFYRREFIQGVALIFRLEEAVLLEAVKEALKVEIKKEGRAFPGFVEAIERDTALKTYLDGKGIGYETPNRLVLKQILRHLAERELDTAEKTRMEKLLTFLDKIGQVGDDIYTGEEARVLSGLRNAGPFAHGFQGVDEDDIGRVYRGGMSLLLEDLQTFLKVQVGPVPENFYDRVNRLLLQVVQELT